MKAFETSIQVRFGHVDPAGIAYYPRLFDYIHDAFEELWEEHVGQRYYHLLLERRIGFPLVASKVNFHHPLRFGDRPKVQVSTVSIGRSSLCLRFLFQLQDQVCLDAEMTTACVDLETMQSIPIEPALRERFEALREDS